MSLFWTGHPNTRPFRKAKGGSYICPVCDYSTTTPQGHQFSAVCYLRAVRWKMLAEGFVECIIPHAFIVMLSGVGTLREGPVQANNGGRLDTEHVTFGLYAPAKVLELIPPVTPSLPKLTQRMRAAILARGFNDPDFLASIDSLRRLGTDVERDSSVLTEIWAVFQKVKVREPEARAFVDRFNRSRKKGEVRYFVACIRSGVGLPGAFWSVSTAADIRAAVVQHCMQDEELAPVLDAARRFDRRLADFTQGTLTRARHRRGNQCTLFP